MKRFPWLLAALALPLALFGSQAGASTLLKTDFSTSAASPWPNAAASSSSKNVVATVALKPVGTVDIVNTKAASGAMLLTVHPTDKGAWSASLVSGLLPVKNSESNLGKLTVSFSLSSSATTPVTVRLESFDAARRSTGSLTGRASPAAPDFYQRYAVDLSTLKPTGQGKFQPAAPFIQFSFEISGAAAGSNTTAGSEYQLRLDNVNYASPAYYVSPQGSDKNDGRTEKTAFATPQKAVDVAQPGDIILLMNGTYDSGSRSTVDFPRAGTPSAWIVLKNYPGQSPLLTSTAWNTVSIRHGSNERPYEGPALAYLEIRGLHVRGIGDIAKITYPEAMNKPDSRTNTNGIAVDGRYMTNIPHDIRIADNLVEYCPAGGICTNETDWVTIENNTCRYNSWTTIYGTSGISTLGCSNFDQQDNVYKILVRNNVCYGNATFEVCLHDKRLTDGNGIIIDVNQNTNNHLNQAFKGRTLVQNNLCFGNGGSGIHTVTANRVDIINNTAYMNSANRDLYYSQIFTYGSDDVRIINNILVAPTSSVEAGETPYPVNRIAGRNTNVVFSHNIYFGGNIPPAMGEGDIIADPRFVNPSRDSKIADFHLLPDSLAIGKGINLLFLPYLDLSGKIRDQSAPTSGAYEARDLQKAH